MAKTTKKHFEIFKQECKKWIDRYGLKSWEFLYEYGMDVGIELTEKRLASYSIDLESRTIVIYFSHDWYDYSPIEEYIQYVAFHEVTEALLGRLKILAKDRFIREDEIEEEIHAIVRTLENVLWKNDVGRTTQET